MPKMRAVGHINGPRVIQRRSPHHPVRTDQGDMRLDPVRQRRTANPTRDAIVVGIVRKLSDDHEQQLVNPANRPPDIFTERNREIAGILARLRQRRFLGSPRFVDQLGPKRGDDDCKERNDAEFQPVLRSSVRVVSDAPELPPYPKAGKHTMIWPMGETLQRAKHRQRSAAADLLTSSFDLPAPSAPGMSCDLPAARAAQMAIPVLRVVAYPQTHQMASDARIEIPVPSHSLCRSKLEDPLDFRRLPRRSPRRNGAQDRQQCSTGRV